MLKSIFILIACLSIHPAFANDGGIAAIKVKEIKMKEYVEKEGKDIEVRRLTHPNFTITLEGEEAAKLQKILPSEKSVITGMYPQLAKEYAKTFKALGIYNNESRGSKGNITVTSKVLTIHCTDGKLEFPRDNVPFIKKTGQTTCTIVIKRVPEEHTSDYFGDASEFNPNENVCVKVTQSKRASSHIGLRIHFHFAIQLLLIAGISIVSGYQIPDLTDANWQTALFLTPIGIVENYAFPNALTSFYGDVSKGQIVLGASAIAQMAGIYFLIFANGAICLLWFKQKTK